MCCRQRGRGPCRVADDGTPVLCFAAGPAAGGRGSKCASERFCRLVREEAAADQVESAGMCRLVLSVASVLAHPREAERTLQLKW